MNSSSDDFFLRSPNNILERAEIYSKTLEAFHELPKEISKSLVVRSKAINETEDIDYAIRMSQYQQTLFKEKECSDHLNRQKYKKIIHNKTQKVVQNLKELEKMTQKKKENYQKHVKTVYTRYAEGEHRERQSQKEKSQELRKNLLEFFQKQKQRKNEAMKKQISVSSCYSDAVYRINSLHKKNEQYAKKAEHSLELSLQRNNKFGERISNRRRVLSQHNKRKEKVYHHGLGILSAREQQFIQTCGKNEDGYLNSWLKIDKSIGDMRKRRGEETKKTLERWHLNKHRVDEIKAQIPERCMSILDKTSKASFRQTATSFRTSAQMFEEMVQRNKDVIRQDDENKKDEIMDLHLDLRLKNTASAKITEKMQSMRQQARKIAYDFL